MIEEYVVWDIVRLICISVSTISVWSLLIAILRSPKVRSNTFNLYLVFCLAPDAVYFLANMLIWVAATVTDVNYAATGEDVLNRYALDMFTVWNDIYWISGILWMSFIVFIQIMKLLMANKQTKRYQPPARKRVIIDSSIVHLVSVVFATVFTLVEWESWRHEWPVLAHNFIWWIPYIPTLFIPTLLMARMCFGVWWNKLLPTNNARYRSLTLFFARLLASAYLMAIVYLAQVLVMWFTPDDAEPEIADKYEVGRQVTFCIMGLIGVFQLCLALTKKDIRVAFVDMWCCRKDVGVKISTTTFGGTVRSTVHESQHHKDENCDDDDDDAEPPAVDDATPPEADLSVENKDIRISGNDEEASTAFVDTKN